MIILDILETPLQTFCARRAYMNVPEGSSKSLLACLIGLSVADLTGFTKGELMAFVKGEGGPHGQVPSFLEQQLNNGRTLASYLKGADQGN